MSRFSISETVGKDEKKEIETTPAPSTCDPVLFGNWRFWMYMLQEFLWHIDFMNFPTILPDFAILNGYDKSQSGLLLTIFGCIVIPARLLGGYAADKMKMNPLLLLTILVAAMGVVSIIFPFTGSSYPAMAVVCGARGALNGLLPVIGPSILILLFTNERMTTSLGYAVFAIGAGQLAAPPMGGKLHVLVMWK
jgi:predicted MFS family arabinose efflux permease